MNEIAFSVNASGPLWWNAIHKVVYYYFGHKLFSKELFNTVDKDK